MTHPPSEQSEPVERALERQAISDLAEHAWRQMSPIMLRTINIADNGLKVSIAVMIATMAIGTAAGTFGKLQGLPDFDSSVREVTLAISA